MKWTFSGSAFWLAALAALPMSVYAQKTTAEGIAEYRAMLADGNPAELYEAKGEGLWKQARGPKNASLEKCDLGKGPGVVKGAFVELPRFFSDTGRVQDLESRLLTCMEQQQGFSAAEIAKTNFGSGEQKTIESLVAYISGESRDMKFNLPQKHAQEKLMYEVGKKVFYLRGVSDPAAPGSKAIVDYTWGKLWNSKAYNACSGMPRFGHAGILDEQQLRDVMALLLDPKSPVNQ